MAHRIRGLVVATLLIGALPAVAAGQTATDQRAWLVATAQHRLSPTSPWQATFEAILRSRDGVSAVDNFAVRPSLFHRLSERSTVGGGYLYARSFPATGGAVGEHRVYAQYLASAPVGGGTMAFRTRVEARFIEGNNGEVTRLRQQVRFTHPWRGQSGVALTGYEELLVHANGAARTPRGVDQNRVFAGVSVPVSQAARLEAGYLNDFIPGHGGPNKMYHVLALTLGVEF